MEKTNNEKANDLRNQKATLHDEIANSLQGEGRKTRFNNVGNFQQKRKIERENLVSRLQEIGEEQSKIRVQIDAIDFEEKSTEINSNLGKCFIEIDKDKDHIACICLCAISESKNGFNAIRINYWKDCDYYFTIENTVIYFSELSHNEEYREIVKEDFFFHYNETIKRKETLFNPDTLK